MKKIAAAMIFVFVGIGLQAQTLTWDIEFRRVKRDETVAINRPIRIETGEEVKITITPATNCFAYVLLYFDADQRYSVGHIGEIKGGEGKALNFTLVNPPGPVTLYVIMSLASQARLERIIQAYNGNQTYENRESLRNEIADLQERGSVGGEPPGIIIPTGVTTKEGEEVVTRFSNREMYVRAITIRH